MEELVSAIHGIEFGLYAIWTALFLMLLFKDCNGSYAIREIKDAIKDLTRILQNINKK